MGLPQQAGLYDRVEAVLGSGHWIGLVCTGGGSQLIAWLLNHAGASRAVVEAQIPYHQAALAAYLEAPGPHPVRPGSAVHLAGEALARVGRLLGEPEGAIGLACTAALTTLRRRRGEDRAFLAIRTATHCTVGTLKWARETADRWAQEQTLSQTALALLSTACAVPAPWPDFPAGVEFSQRDLDLSDPLGLLYSGTFSCVSRRGDGTWTVDVKRGGRLLLPGSFNPLHEGHLALLAAAERIRGVPGAFELSIANVDKPALGRAEVERRAAQFGRNGTLLCTCASTFLEKSRLFGECTFVVGFDTAARLLDPVYYGSRERLDGAFEEMAHAGTRFLVAGRLSEGKYRSLGDLDLPEKLRPLFAEIPPDQFRMDISSTQLRTRIHGTAED